MRSAGPRTGGAGEGTGAADEGAGAADEGAGAADGGAGAADEGAGAANEGAGAANEGAGLDGGAGPSRLASLRSGESPAVIQIPMTTTASPPRPATQRSPFFFCSTIFSPVGHRSTIRVR